MSMLTPELPIAAPPVGANETTEAPIMITLIADPQEDMLLDSTKKSHDIVSIYTHIEHYTRAANNDRFWGRIALLGAISDAAYLLNFSSPSRWNDKIPVFAIGVSLAGIAAVKSLDFVSNKTYANELQNHLDQLTKVKVPIPETEAQKPTRRQRIRSMLRRRKDKNSSSKPLFATPNHKILY